MPITLIIGFNFLQKIVFLLLPLIAASGCINDFYDLKINKAANTESTELFDAFVSENISFSGCSNSGYSHLGYGCTPTVTAAGADVEWSLDSTNTCTFLIINSATGSVSGGPNKNEPVTCNLVFRISTPTLTGKDSKTIKFAQGVSRFGVAYKAVATYQQYSYWGVDSKIDVYDSTSPANPTYVGFQSSIWGVDGMSMHVHGQYLYVTSGGGFSIFSLSDPSKPKFVLHIGTGAAGFDVAFYGNYALLANKANGIVIIDISDPIKAKIVTTIDTAGDARGIKIRGNHAYTLQVWLGIGDVVWAPGTLAYYGGNVYFASGWSGTRRVNVADPAKIYYDGAIYTGDHPYVARTDENGYLYIAGYRNGFHIIKLSP